MKPLSFFKKNTKPAGKYWQLNEKLLEEIAAIKLPFSSKNYYAFCDKYLKDDVHEALFLDSDEKYFREITADYETLRYISYLQGLFKSPPTLCDIGCGIGNVVLHAGKIGYQAFGYEINTSLKPIHKKAKVEVLYADILHADLLALKEVDVVYLYRPINDTKMMNRLLSLVHKHAKQDVIVLYNYPHTRSVKSYQTVLLGEHDDMIALLKT